MKKILIFLFLYMMCGATAYAHAGRTDAYGGHYDNETGEYHYHHGYPAHLTFDRPVSSLTLHSIIYPLSSIPIISP